MHKNLNKTHNRLTSVDIAKGIGILAIMLGHFGIANHSGQDVLGPWLYQFHVPVFFIVAGYFQSTKRPLGLYVRQKASRLLVPYIITAAAVIAFTAVLIAVRGESWPSIYATPSDALKSALYASGSYYNKTLWGIRPIGALWFLPALFIALVIDRICMQWRFGWMAEAALSVLAFWGMWAVWLPFSIWSAFVGSLLIAVGRLLRKWDYLAKPVKPLHFIAGTACFIAFGLFNTRLSVASLLTATYPPIALATAIVSSIWVLLVSQLIAQHVQPLCRPLAYVGRNSLTVLCLHLLMIDIKLKSLLLLAGMSGNSLSLTNFAIQVAIILALIPLIKRTPFLKKYF